MNAPVIAVIDDDKAILAGLSSLLRSAGYRVVLYKTAEAFLGQNRAKLPGCVLTDVQMPGMNGLELQAELQRRHPELPIVFMTAFPEEAIREQAMKAGALAFFNKPFEADAVLQVLAAAIAGQNQEEP
jgi:FixJ family two-component response regulator